MLSPERTYAISAMSQFTTRNMMSDVEMSDRLSQDLSSMDSASWFIKRFSPYYKRIREDRIYDRNDALSRIVRYGEELDILANTSDLEIGTKNIGPNSENRKPRTWISGVAFGRNINLSETRNGGGEVIIRGTIDGKPVKDCQDQAKITFFGLQEVLTQRERLTRIIQNSYSPSRSYR